MTDGIPSLLRCRWWTAPETSYSSRTDSSTRNGSSANRMHLHGRERFPLQFNPLLRHPRNGHTCRWRGALFGLAISTSHPDPYLFYKGGGPTQEGLLPLPLLSPCAASNPTAGLPAPSDPTTGCGTCPSGVVVAPPLACQKLFTSPWKYTSSDGINWEGRFGYCIPQGGKLPILLGFLSQTT